LTEEKAASGEEVEQEFSRKTINVHELFRDPLVGHLVEGKVADKQKLEKDKLKISSRLVNFVVAGGVLFFNETKEADTSGQGEEGTAGEEKMDEASLFTLLEKTIRIMLNQLNQPEVNLLKSSLSKSFQRRLQEIFTAGSSEASDHFPVKIFRDIHPQVGSFIGINMRDTRSLGEDLNRIERDENLKREIAGHRRPVRHGDGDLALMFAPSGPDKP